MPALAAAGGSFLLAVLWFDLMFDVQVLAHRGPVLPAPVLASIAAYYRRVTTDANPMGRLVAVVMAGTLICLIAELLRHDAPLWSAWPSLVLVLGAVGLVGARAVRNAVRLGGGEGSPEERSALARAILRDHLSCFASMAVAVGLQLAAALSS